MIQSAAGRPGRDYYARYLAHYARKNFALLVFGGLFMTGVGLGAVLLRTAQGETLEIVLKLVDTFLSQRARQNLGQVFFSCAGSSLLFLSVLFVCGFCAISQPVVVLVPLLRGLGFGFSVSGLYAQYGLSATGYVALFLAPDMLVSTLALLLCSRESLRLSGSFLGAVGSHRQGREFYSLRLYGARYIAAAALCLVSAFAQAVLFTAFANIVVLR